MEFISINNAIKQKKGEVKIRGWIYRIRKLKDKIFIVLRDSSNILQCIVKKSDLIKKADKLLIESSLEIQGSIYPEKRAPTNYELEVDKINIIQIAEDFPIDKDQTPEFLLDKRHLWLRSRKMTSILKIRSTILFALHKSLRKKDFIEIEAPCFNKTTSEGGSDTFEVNYFGKKAYLTQSWQFYAENIINSIEKAYTIAPSFRAEKSRTPRHLTEFWHCEVEGAWINLENIIKIAEDCVIDSIKEVIKENEKELEILNVKISRLNKIKSPFPRITYKKAIEKLQKTGHKIKYGDDFKSDEERDLAKYYKGNFVIVTNYPLKILKFYHGEDAKNPKTGMNFNILAPFIGEIIDGSQREPDLKKIKQRLKESKIDLKDSDWYLDSRRYGSVPHSGFGLGTERLIQWICGLETIKDAIPFPRTPTRLSP